MKTPIEQLIEDLIKHDLIKADGFTTTLMLKAKQVEYEQILNTHKLAKFFTSGDEYYNTTFKNTNDEKI
jgi:thiamine biosynthesis lipoprotein ApbE